MFAFINGGLIRPTITTNSSTNVASLSSKRTHFTTGARNRPSLRIVERANNPAAIRMRVATDGDSVNVHYSGFLDDGTMFDSSRDRDEPLNFVVGAGTVIRGFDDAVRGLKIGESRKTRIEPQNAYGARSDDLLITLPHSGVPEGMDLEAGARVPLSNGMRALVVEINEKEVRLDANHELAGKPLTFDMQLVSFEEHVLGPVANGLERAVFGLGCFWGAELAYQRVEGVVSTKVGYTQGSQANPTYQQVCSGSTGHAEAIAVDYDASKVSFGALVDLFWDRLGKSALTLNQVGNDVGSQYRSGIYYQSEAQQKIAEDSCKAVSKELGEEVVVEVKDGLDAPFYLAESYHQQYVNYIQRLAVFRCGDVENKGLTPTSDPVDCGMETIVVADISRRVGRALKKVLLRRFGVTDKVCVSIAVMRQHQPIEVHVNWKQLMGKYHLEHGTLTSSLNCAGR